MYVVRYVGVLRNAQYALLVRGARVFRPLGTYTYSYIIVAALFVRCPIGVFVLQHMLGICLQRRVKGVKTGGGRMMKYCACCFVRMLVFSFSYSIYIYMYIIDAMRSMR